MAGVDPRQRGPGGVAGGPGRGPPGPDRGGPVLGAVVGSQYPSTPRGGLQGLQLSLPVTGGPGGQTLSLLVVANSALLTLRLSRGRRGWTLAGLSHAWRSSVGRTMASFVS